jgi:hypothetical protein
MSAVQDLEETEEDAESVKLRRSFDSDIFDSDSFLGKRITPPRILAVNGLSKAASGCHRIESGERVKLDLVRDSQGIWKYVPSPFPALAAPGVNR